MLNIKTLSITQHISIICTYTYVHIGIHVHIRAFTSTYYLELEPTAKVTLAFDNVKQYSVAG